MSSMPTKTTPIAIIGMACRFPGDANTPDRLWELCAAAQNTWSKMPKNRINGDAFYHPRPENLGTIHSQGGHFLNEDVSCFDTSFFSINADLAKAMDPQLRILYETTFEAFESAGLPLEKVAGTSTSVFAGAMFHDYNDMLVQDIDNLPRYVLTGTSPGVVANRLSHFFDLQGPSVAVDTACSTAMVALHLACQSLRSGESSMSVVGGTNLILFPSSSLGLSNLGLTGATGKSFGFDDRAEGYGRGEGVASIVLKPLDAALRDGDPIRAVIRETGSNQDGKTPTITSPSQEAQEKLIKSCYERAGLNPINTAYVESHGTGTVAGDTTEANALGNTIGLGRSAEEPLYVGSVKANVGHTESTSGLAAIIKVVQMLERGYIPPHALFTNPNSKIDFKKLNIKIPTEMTPWPAHSLRRVSINNFGAGGTNTHAIIEDARYHLSARHNGVVSNGVAPNGVVPNGSSLSGDRLLFTISAREEKGARESIRQLENYLESGCSQGRLSDLAYTLGQRRSHFAWRAAISAQSIDELRSALGDSNLHPVQASLARVPRLGFVFTGQGAQWHAMGRELIAAYPAFREALEDADKHVKSLGATWSVIEELSRDEKLSQVSKPQFSFPLSVIIQLALVRLLESWGVVPNATTGHSSGEISAAYAAQILTFEDAITIAYVRGHITAEFVDSGRLGGGMTALATSKEVALEYLRDISSGTAVIGCVNSQNSVTISGDVSALADLEARAESEGAFFRRLKVPAAYHSTHMDPLAREYHQRLDNYLQKPTLPESKIIFSSPVTGRRVENSEKRSLSEPSHWVQNMVQCVQFEDALKDMLISDESEKAGGTQFTVDAIIEIGPHGALQGPIRQILAGPALKECTATNGPSLKRGEDAVRTMGSLASRLFCQGYPVNFEAVNFPNHFKNLQVINDLPAYPWNHSAKYWVEPAAVTESLHRKFPHHDLLGLRIPNLGSDVCIWRNVLRISNVPWLADHTVQTQILFPGAGWATMAVEAMRQLTSPDESIGGYVLSDIELHNALVVPTTDDGVEIQCVVRNQSPQVLDPFNRKEIAFFSKTRDGKWTGHCRGKIALASGKVEFSTLETDESKLTTLDMDTFYDRISRGGPTLGPSFQNVSSLAYGGGSAVATLTVADTISFMPAPFESSYLVHPTTMDACFQIAWGTMPGSMLDQMGLCLPEFAKRFYIPSETNQQPGTRLKAIASLSHIDQQGFEVSLSLFEINGQEERLVMKSEGLRVKSLTHKSTQMSNQVDNTAVLKPIWKPDVSVLSTKDFQNKDINAAGLGGAYSPEESQRVVVNIIHDALEQLDKDKPSLEDHHRKLVSLLRRHNEELYGSLAVRDEGKKRELYQKFISSDPNGQLFGLLSDKLIGFLEKKTTPEENFILDQLLQTYSENTPQYNLSLEKLKEYVSLFAHKYPRARILEVGAGVGTASAAILQGLSQANPGILSVQRYDYTDVSTSSLSNAEKRFESFGSQIRYQELDIEQNPTEQGFTAGSYDLVIACNTLHTTANISKSVNNIRQLLKAGGTALILETTTTRLEQCLAFGLRPGWWSSEEKERQSSPLLDTKSWESVLSEHGFNSPDVVLHDSENIDGSTYSFLAVTVTDNTPQSATYPRETVLVQLPKSLDAAPQNKLDQLGQLLHNSTGTVVSVAELGEVSLQNKSCIIWIQSKSKFLSNISPENFNALQKAMLEADSVLWVSHSAAEDGDEAEAAMSVGFLRTLRLEDASKTYVTLELDPQQGCWDPAAIQVVSDTFRYSLSSDNREHREYEFAVRSGQLHVPRFVGSQATNEEFGRLQGQNPPQLKPFSFSGPYTRLEAAVPGLLDSLIFKEDDAAWQSSTWTEEMVEITPHAFGLNFRDVLVAMDQMQEKWMGFECAGYVSRVGSKVPASIKVGDRVCALLQAGHWANKVRTPFHSVMSIPPNMTLEMAASLPIIFGTAYHALIKLANLEAGESVLIHAAAGGVGQAAITVAKYLKADIFVTVGSEEKRNFLAKEYGIARDHMFSSRDVSFAEDVMQATGGRGVDVVLNSLTGPLLQASWDCVAPLGRFIELGKQDSQGNKSLGMRNFANSTAYIAMDLIKLGFYNGKTLQNTFRNVSEMFAKEQIKHKVPILLYELSNVREAFRKLQGGRNIGKFIVRIREGEQIQTIISPKPPRFDPLGSYLIVGGLSGIGREIALWMARQGAKNLILMSRRAEEQEDAPSLAAELLEAGAQTVFRSCDVGDKASLGKAVSECRKKLPIRGVVQSAVVLQDSTFSNMTQEKWHAAVGPKVQGTENLNGLFQDSDLEFFVILSSSTCILGNGGQTNYTAGGAYQDALAWNRVSKGLPAVSINIGSVPTLGVAARTGVGAKLDRVGFRAQEVPELLHLIQVAILNPHQGQMVTGVKAWTAPGDLQWRREPRFASLWLPGSGDGSNDQEEAQRSLKNRLLQSSSETARGMLVEALKERLADVFGMSASEVDSEMPLTAYGVDSLVAGELRNWLILNVVVGVSIFDVTQSNSLRDLAARLQERLVEESE
ncbi:hypothetical protein ACHAQJ_003341 [Trichoderma viride]